MKRLLAGTLVLASMLVLPAVAPAANGPKHKDNDTYVQLLAINDLHGHLQPNTPGTIQVGCCNPVFNTATFSYNSGAEWLEVVNILGFFMQQRNGNEIRGVLIPYQGTLAAGGGGVEGTASFSY